MRILLTKLTDQRHLLEIVRSDDSREGIELVTREALFHDLLHHAVESSMPTQGGFWGCLARGKTFDDLNDRSGVRMKDAAATLYEVEAAVGMMTGVIDLSAEEAWTKLCWYHETQAAEMPRWCTESFVIEVRERMRRMLGHWKATPYGESMEIIWPETDSSASGIASRRINQRVQLGSPPARRST